MCTSMLFLNMFYLSWPKLRRCVYETLSHLESAGVDSAPLFPNVWTFMDGLTYILGSLGQVWDSERPLLSPRAEQPGQRAANRNRRGRMTGIGFSSRMLLAQPIQPTGPGPFSSPTENLCSAGFRLVRTEIESKAMTG